MNSSLASPQGLAERVQKSVRRDVRKSRLHFHHYIPGPRYAQFPVPENEKKMTPFELGQPHQEVFQKPALRKLGVIQPIIA